MGFDTKTYRLTDRQSQYDFDRDQRRETSGELSRAEKPAQPRSYQTGSEITRRETRSAQKQEENQQKSSHGVLNRNIRVRSLLVVTKCYNYRA
jgi:hypothetical protein